MDSDDDDAYFLEDDGNVNGDESSSTVQRMGGIFNLFRMRRQRISVPGPMAQSQKGGTRPGAGRGASMHQQQRPVTPLSSLLEYEDEDEGAVIVSNAPAPDVEGGAPRSPVLQHRQIQILPYDPLSEPFEDEGVGSETASPSSSGGASSDPEDDLLEALVPKSVKQSQQQQPTPRASPVHLSAEKRKAGAPPPEAPRLREKRRRSGDDEEEDMLERLVPKNRRVSAGAGTNANMVVAGQEPGAKGRHVQQGLGAGTGTGTGNGNGGKKGPGEGEEGPRRFRLKFGAVGAKMLGSADNNHKPTLASKADSKGGGNG